MMQQLEVLVLPIAYQDILKIKIPILVKHVMINAKLVKKLQVIVQHVDKISTVIDIFYSQILKHAFKRAALINILKSRTTPANNAQADLEIG
jgi:hypothetical protein